MRKLIVFFILVFFTGIVLGNDLWIRVTESKSLKIDYMNGSYANFVHEGERFHASKFRWIQNNEINVFVYMISNRDCKRRAGTMAEASAATNKFIQEYEFVLDSGNMASHIAGLICFQAKHAEAADL